MRKPFYISFLILIPLAVGLTMFNQWFGIFLAIVLVLFAIGLVDILQKKQTLRRNFPILGNLRYVFEHHRPKIYQYFVESDLDGRPINRVLRSIVYQRAKAVKDTVPFGTQLDVYERGYEWINYSMKSLDYDQIDYDPRVLVGNKQCGKPYSASILNISAMSYGSLSKNAVLALNKGAKLGGFYHNTGEGAISEHHLVHGGDLVWQIGTGYFGCRTEMGYFDFEKYKEKATLENVKMIELKISQGAKPGHGGILPASKITEEIARIRHVKMGQDVVSPPTHSAFNTPLELCEFIKDLREGSGAKPVGVKLCLGDRREFVAFCKAMVETKIYPDFITVDGAEGGTGAAPLEFSNHIGTPLYDGLVFVIDCLQGFGLREHIKVFASGKVVSGFDIVRLLSIGADAVNAARAMMLALGCIQALECDKNTCPTGIATQDKGLMKGLNVEEKSVRVFRYHKNTIASFSEIISAAGLTHACQLKRCLIYKRLNEREVFRYDELYPVVEPHSMLSIDTAPERYKFYLQEASSSTFDPV